MKFLRPIAGQILGSNAVSFDNIVACTAEPGHKIVHLTIQPGTQGGWRIWQTFKTILNLERFLEISNLGQWSQTLP